VTTGAKHLTLTDLVLDALNGITGGGHRSYCQVFTADMVKFQDTGITLTANFAEVSQKILIDKFPCGFTGRGFSFSDIL